MFRAVALHVAQLFVQFSGV